jgi:hypothetical protein
MEVIDTGHEYRLHHLDGAGCQVLRFVKREGAKFPKNLNSYAGTTSQDVIRCLLERTRYVQSQIFALETAMVIVLLSLSLWVLEFRAARRNRMLYLHSPVFAENAPMCEQCSHTVCRCSELGRTLT